MQLDIASQQEEIKLDWIELLAYVTAKNGANFDNFKTKELDSVANLLREGKTMEELTENLKYYSYYLEAYEAVLAEFVENMRLK